MDVIKAENKLPSSNCYFRLVEDEDDDHDCYYAYYVSSLDWLDFTAFRMLTLK